MVPGALERALRPYEEQLHKQEMFRRSIGVKAVNEPTYNRYITGPVQRIDFRRNAFLRHLPDNPYAEGFPERFKKATGVGNFMEELPPSELGREERIAASLFRAAYRVCKEYEPHPLRIPPPEGRVEAESPGDMSRLIKKVALFLGADLIGITRINPQWVYANKEVPEPFAIVVGVSHRLSFYRTAPSYISGVETAEMYSRLKYITTQLADFIRGLGYPAVYRETRGFDPDMLMIPLAIDAGIGEFARTGGILTPEFGINIRLKAVTTDLPLAPDKPISFGAHDFCMGCELCARACPPRAIAFGPPTDQTLGISNVPGYRKWYIDAEKCLTFWGMNKKKWGMCGARCIAACPWANPLTAGHNLVRWAAIRGGPGIKKMLARGAK